jgi:hypothetical protein
LKGKNEVSFKHTRQHQQSLFSAQGPSIFVAPLGVLQSLWAFALANALTAPE